MLGVTEEYKDYGILGDDALFPYFRNAWYDRGDMYCVSSVRSRRLVVDNGGMAGFAGYDAPRLCSSWLAQAWSRRTVTVTCTWLVMLVAMHLAQFSFFWFAGP